MVIIDLAAWPSSSAPKDTMRKHAQQLFSAKRLLLPVCSAALSLAACGGGGSTADSGNANATNTTLAIDAATLPPEASAQVAQPGFHLAPVLLDAPSDVDAANNIASAALVPHSQSVPAESNGLQTRGLTIQAIQQAQRAQVLSAPTGGATPAASIAEVTTYTPAQVRAAYSLPSIPLAGTAPTAAQAAQLGAGQTIYIVDAMHDPNIVAELSAFNQKFGLSTCTTQSIAPTSPLPLAAANATSGCVLSVVYGTANAKMSATAPIYDSGWASEIALDVEWAHATAPLARIVLIEAPENSLSGLLGAVKLANAMGPGVVSMSFGAIEGGWTTSVDSAFSVSGMSYLAATGDAGAAVEWPAVSSNVVAVGGTSLTYDGSTPRTEVTWAGTGGGISQYVSTPAYQANTVPGVGSPAHRSVADVSFNADPYTGQYVAIIPQGSSSTRWVSAGGTSLATPQWAGIMAIGNAMRAFAGQQLLGAPHATLYGRIAAVPATYAAALADIRTGSDGTCATCAAKPGYDQPTGLGTPNVSALLTALTGAPVTPAAPVVNAASISGKAGVALSFNVSATSPDPVTYALTNAPSGMTVASTGVVSWSSPVTGTYAVTIAAKDATTGLSGQGIYTVNISAAAVAPVPPVAPVVASTTIHGNPGAPLSYAATVSAGSATSFSLSNAPSGMTISSTGVMTWPRPVTGTYPVTVTASNASNGLSGEGVLTVVIAQGQPPVITATGFSGAAGQLLTGTLTFADPGGNALSVEISNIPRGITFSLRGQSLILSWANPVVGTYDLAVTATDTVGLTTRSTVPIIITAK